MYITVCRDALIGSMADALTSFYGGFVIFSVLGYMSYEAKLPIDKVATSGSIIICVRINVFFVGIFVL